HQLQRAAVPARDDRESLHRLRACAGSDCRALHWGGGGRIHAIGLPVGEAGTGDAGPVAGWTAGHRRGGSAVADARGDAVPRGAGAEVGGVLRADELRADGGGAGGVRGGVAEGGGAARSAADVVLVGGAGEAAAMRAGAGGGRVRAPRLERADGRRAGGA